MQYRIEMQLVRLALIRLHAKRAGRSLAAT
jgi:hypothetical protein